MILPNAQIVSDLENALSIPFKHELLKVIQSSWLGANQAAEFAGIDPRLDKQYRPMHRKMMVDTKMAALARKHFNIKGDIRANATGSHLYTELIIEDRIILTASVVDSPNLLPRPSKFRKESALNNPSIEQLKILEPNLIQTDFVKKTYQGKPLIYGVIIHGPSKSSSPEFVILAVPDASYRFQIGTVNLLERYSKPVTVSDIDLSIQEVDKPAARLRTVIEESVEQEDRSANEGERGGGDS